MAGQGELLRAVLDQETGERRKKGGEADLDEPSGALPREGVVGDEPRQRRQGSGHKELYEGEHDGVPTGGVVPNGDDLSREHERRGDGQDISEVHRSGEVRRQEPHADETDQGRRQGEPAGEEPSQAPQEQGHEDHIPRGQEGLSARRGVVQAEGLEPHAQEEKQADDGAISPHRFGIRLAVHHKQILNRYTNYDYPSCSERTGSSETNIQVRP